MYGYLFVLLFLFFLIVLFSMFVTHAHVEYQTPKKKHVR